MARRHGGGYRLDSVVFCEGPIRVSRRTNNAGEAAATTLAMVDALEPRRLLASFATAINFQNKKSDTPGGYNADVGRAFSTQDHGLNYGWDASNVGWGIDRHSPAKLRYDTLAYFGGEGQAKTWEIEVPNGLYRVQIMAGDPKYTNSRYNIDAEGEPVLNSKPTKKTWYRTGTTDVFVSDGRLTITSGGQAKNNKINSINITQIDPHATGQDVVNPASNAGVVQNEMPADVAIPVLKKLGMKTVRLWYAVKSWDDAPDYEFLDYFKAHHDAGFATVVIFSTPSVPTGRQVYNFFARMVDDPVARASIDYWEIGNEPEHGFFPGTLKEYVQDVLAPAYEVLHLANKPVVGAAPTWNVDVAKELESYGYSDYCDYSNFHPYGSDAQQVIDRATQAKAIFGDKPLIISEWNIQFQSDPQEWARQVKLASVGLAQISFMSFYFALSVSDVHVGRGGIVNPDGTPNGPFYDVAETWAV